MKRLSLWLLLLVIGYNSFGQNYIEYQRTFNRIDEDVLSQNYNLAIKRLDSVYSGFEFIYAKHCVKALQICVRANDSINADKWLAKCFKQGIPIWIIRNNDITKKSLIYSTTQMTLEDYDRLYSIYKASIDTNLARKIDSLLTIDQKYTRKVNDGFVLFRFSIYWLQWGINNKRQLRILKQIIENHGYPEERLIGFGEFLEDSMAAAKHITFYGPSEIREASVQIMMQHCFSTWHKVDLDFKNTLYQNLCNGYMPSFQYAIIIDFMCFGRKKYINDMFSVCNKKSDKDYIDKINRNRKSIGLTTLEQQKRNMLLARERRGSKKANSEIMLEY
ncbi:MAG: hypothetical protein K9J13_08285 [Saprospiraceae bacterium]|nr:hypothetical protein [Saprospiraceae bacterium]